MIWYSELLQRLLHARVGCASAGRRHHSHDGTKQLGVRRQQLDEMNIATLIPWGYYYWIEGDNENPRLLFKEKWSNASVLDTFPPTDRGCKFDLKTEGNEFLEIKNNAIGGNWTLLRSVIDWFVKDKDIIAFRCTQGMFLHGARYSTCLAGYWSPWGECRNTVAANVKILDMVVPDGYTMVLKQGNLKFVPQYSKRDGYNPIVATVVWLVTTKFPDVEPCTTKNRLGVLFARSARTGHKVIEVFRSEDQKFLIALHGEPVQVMIHTDSSRYPSTGYWDAYCNNGLITDAHNSMRACSKSQAKSGLTYMTSITGGQFLPINLEQRDNMGIFALHGESVLLRIKTADFQIYSPLAYCNNGGLSFATRSERPCITPQGWGRHLYVRSATLVQENVLLMQTRHVIIALHGEPVTMNCDDDFTRQRGSGEGRCENGKIVPLPSCLRNCQAFTYGQNVAIERVAAILDEPNEAKVTFRDYPEQIRHGARYSVRCSHENQFFDFPYIECNNGTWFGSSEEIITGKTETAPLSDFAGPLSVRCRPQSAGRSGGGRGRGGRGGRGVAIGPGIDDLD